MPRVSTMGPLMGSKTMPPSYPASCMSQAGRKLTTNTQGAAHGDGSTSGGEVSNRTFGPGNEQPVPYTDAGNGVDGVLPGLVSAWAIGATNPVRAVAARAEASVRWRMSRLFMVDLLVMAVLGVLSPPNYAALATSL